MFSTTSLQLLLRLQLLSTELRTQHREEKEEWRLRQKKGRRGAVRPRRFGGFGAV